MYGAISGLSFKTTLVSPFSSVTFELSSTPVSVKAQNLVTEETVDITDKVKLDKRLEISGEILSEINGTIANKPAIRLIVTY